MSKNYLFPAIKPWYKMIFCPHVWEIVFTYRFEGLHDQYCHTCGKFIERKPLQISYIGA